MIVAMVPMKPLPLAKRRLARVLPQAELQALVRAMFCDVLEALQKSNSIGQSFVVTADTTLAAIAKEHGTEHLAEKSAIGLNDAVALAARHAVEENAEAMLVLPGDVPLATAAEIDDFVLRSGNHGLGIVPAHDGDGTNSLLLAPPNAIAPSFGAGSFKRHLAAGKTAGVEVVTCKFSGLGHDIDTPEDLDFLATQMADRVEYDCLRSTVLPGMAGKAKLLEQQCG